MFPAGTSAREQIDSLATALGFDWHDQDWGIVNADATRVAEFADFFERNYDKDWSPWTVAEYVDLVMESASDAIRNDPHFSIAIVDRFVALAAPIAPEQFAYWTSHEWAITPHLRELGL